MWRVTKGHPKQILRHKQKYMNKEELQKIIVKLIELGEDKDELNYWSDIYSDLPEEKQKEVFDNLRQELDSLESA